MSNYIVYMHISPSGKRYIGITSQEPKKRWNNGKGYKGQIFYNAINKYGWDNIEHIIIAKELTKEEAEWLEIELIREFDTTNPSKGYNVTKGGEGTSGYKPTDEQRQKHSERVSGENNPMFGRQHTEEWKQNMSERMSGESHPLYGTHHTEEWCREHSERMSGESHPMFGKTHSEESKQKNREAHLGKTHTEESKKKMSKARSGKNNPLARKVICVTTNEIFDTLKEGADKYNIKSSSHITNCCKGDRKSCGKHPITGEPLRWKYYDEYLKEQEQNGVA